MLVEINLLPERKPRKSSFIFLFVSILSVIVVVSAVYFLQGQSIKAEMASVNRELTLTQKIAARDTNPTNKVPVSTSVSQLENAIKWTNEYSIKSVPVMRKLNALLPERGFIQSFAYTEAGTINLTVQFDTASEAAYFLNSLTGSKWIQDASLNSLTTAPLPVADAANTETQTYSSAAVNGTSNTPGTNVPAVGTSGNAGNQAGTIVVGQSTQTYNPTVNIQESGSTADSSGQTGTADSNIVPRYIGQFVIELNEDVLKQDTKKSSQTGEGGTGS